MTNSLIAEIISTGDEVRTGAVADTNAAYLSACLEDRGIYVKRHTVVGDDKNDLVSVFKEVGKRSDIAVVTGGIGPTDDDITGECAAEAAGLPLVLDPEALKGVEAFFIKRNRPMPDGNKKQAMFPKGAVRLDNPYGTAPGFSIGIEKAIFYFMPGVPSEMRKMVKEQVLPRLNNLMGDRFKTRRIRSVSTFGLPESTVNIKLKGLSDVCDGVRLGLRAHFPEIYVRLYAEHEDEAAANAALSKAYEFVGEKLGNCVLSFSGEPMEAVVGDFLRKKGKTLAVAESCTGGLISNMITNVSGSSDYFLFSGVTYSNECKERVLGVSHDTLISHGAVHEETAKEMAAGAKKISGADFGLATTGIAGPDGGTVEKPVGTVCIGIAYDNEVHAKRYSFFFNDRDKNKRIFAAAALNILRKTLLNPKPAAAF